MIKWSLVNSSFLDLNQILHLNYNSVKLIFLSSIFKKNKNYIGIYNFRYLKNITNKKVVALGGITKLNKRKLKLID